MKHLTTLTIALCLGCQSAPIQDSSAIPEVDEPSMQVIAEKQQAQFADAVYVVSRLWELKTMIEPQGDEADKTYAARFNNLASAKVVRPKWQRDTNRVLTRGRLAYMVTGVLDFKSGVVTSLIGRTERYSLRELSYRRVMTGGAADAWVSGSELVSVATRVAEQLEDEDLELEGDF